jgi:formylglycine-generating enzyme required for sulfatase activity
MLTILLLICSSGVAVAAQEIPEGMVLVPGGRFAMGVAPGELEELAVLGREVPHMSHHYRSWFAKETPLHEVEVDSFYLDAAEVTNSQFARFVAESGVRVEGDWRRYAGEGREDHPVLGVTWADALAYADWVGCRLPSEAEWEWAARGGASSRWFPWGDQTDNYEKANYGHDRTFWTGLRRLIGFRPIKSVPVATFEPNAYGLYDMQGNAAEWCADELLPYPGGTSDAYPFSEEGYFDRPWKVCRGGSWQSPNPVHVRCNYRSGRRPDFHDGTVGFRCARSVASSSSAN